MGEGVGGILSCNWMRQRVVVSSTKLFHVMQHDASVAMTQAWCYGELDKAATFALIHERNT